MTGRSNLALAVAAAESFLGKQVDPAPAEDATVPGRLERVGDAPLEIWDGAHNLGGVGYVLARLPSRRYVVVASILADKDVDGMLAALSALGDTFVATRSTNSRALAAGELAAKAGRFFDRVETVADPAEAVEQARALAGARRRGPGHGLPLSARRPGHRPTAGSRTMSSVGERLSVFVLAAFVLVAIVALSFGAGWLVGKILL